MNQQLFFFFFIIAQQQQPAEKEEELIRMRKVSHFTLSPNLTYHSCICNLFKKTVLQFLHGFWVGVLVFFKLSNT